MSVETVYRSDVQNSPTR